MVIDNYIRRDHLPYLVEYFKFTGWKIQTPKSASEAFRATRRDHRRPVLLFRKNDTDFLVADSRDIQIFKKFMTWYNTKGEDLMNTMETRITQMENDIKAIKAALGLGDGAPVQVGSDVKSCGESRIKQEVTRIMTELGVPAHILGHRYLREAIMISVNDVGMLDHMTKGLYPQVAKTFQTTPSRVERAIRHAIEVAWDRGDLDTLEKFFGNTISGEKGKPTNSEFLAMVTDRLLTEGVNNAVD